MCCLFSDLEKEATHVLKLLGNLFTNKLNWPKVASKNSFLKPLAIKISNCWFSVRSVRPKRLLSKSARVSIFIVSLFIVSLHRLCRLQTDENHMRSKRFPIKPHIFSVCIQSTTTARLLIFLPSGFHVFVFWFENHHFGVWKFLQLVAFKIEIWIESSFCCDRWVVGSVQQKRSNTQTNQKKVNKMESNRLLLASMVRLKALRLNSDLEKDYEVSRLDVLVNNVHQTLFTNLQNIATNLNVFSPPQRTIALNSTRLWQH